MLIADLYNIFIETRRRCKEFVILPGLTLAERSSTQKTKQHLNQRVFLNKFPSNDMFSL